MNKAKLTSYVIHFAGQLAVEAEDEDQAMEAFAKLAIDEYDDVQIVEIDQV